MRIILNLLSNYRNLSLLELLVIIKIIKKDYCYTNNSNNFEKWSLSYIFEDLFFYIDNTYKYNHIIDFFKFLILMSKILLKLS